VSSIGAPLRNLEGGTFTNDFERGMKGALEVECLSMCEYCEGNLRGGDSFPGDPGGYVKEGFGDGHLSP